VAERVLICGDRNWDDYQTVLDALSEVHQQKGVEVVIEGEAPGADLMGRKAAVQLGIPYLPFPADWRKHGKSAGPIRNRQQHKEGKPTMGLAFHNFIENSKGTKDMVNVLRGAGVPVTVIKDTKHRPKGEK
jgi:hypothetical protein